MGQKSKRQGCLRGQEKKVSQEGKNNQCVNATDKLRVSYWVGHKEVTGNSTVGHFGRVAGTQS